MTAKTLLIELGTEELPPKALLTLSESFTQGICSAFTALQIPYGKVSSYATPRRLAVKIEQVGEQPAQTIVRKGPPVKAAYDATGQPTKAALGFAASFDVTMDALEQQDTDKGAWLIYQQHIPAQPLSAILEGIVAEALTKLPIPKRMRWSDLPYEFVRPVHWLVALHGKAVLPLSIMGLTASNQSRGHRFLHTDPIVITDPDDYESQMEKGFVCADFKTRRARITEQTLAIAKTLGGEPVWNEDLIDEVTGLVEWPTALTGSFEQRFLDVPSEVLVSAMQDHQRYFPLRSASGLLPHFVFITNMKTEDPSQIVHGNERVIRARLEDASFFYETDKKTPLKARTKALDALMFEKRLGTVGDKTKRMAAIAERLCSLLGFDAKGVAEAAALSKADLSTGMVGEFPELQGIMGQYYAAHDGVAPEVCLSIAEHYLPRNAADVLPTSPLGIVLSLADRLDTLVGFFGHNEIPTGTKDPFALRRAAFGVIKVCIEKSLSLSLKDALEAAVQAHSGLPNKNAAQDVLTFCLARLTAYFAETGISAMTTDAAIACGSSQLYDLSLRVAALHTFQSLPEARSLAAANKRVGNLLKKSSPANSVSAALFESDAENTLAAALNSMEGAIKALVEKGDYTQALQHLATLKPAVDKFFDDVMVMVDNPEVAKNRLALLAQLQRVMMSVGDISTMATD